jgi:hypothetical protein
MCQELAICFWCVLISIKHLFLYIFCLFEDILCVFIQNRNSVYNGASNYTVCTLFGDANFIENYVFVSGKTYLEDNGIETKSLPTIKEN